MLIPTQVENFYLWISFAREPATFSSSFSKLSRAASRPVGINLARSLAHRAVFARRTAADAKKLPTKLENCAEINVACVVSRVPCKTFTEDARGHDRGRGASF